MRNAFIKMGLNPIILGDADKNRLPPEDQVEWGSYYEQKPQIMAVQRIDRRGNPRIPEAVISETGMPEAVACLQCQICA